MCRAPNADAPPADADDAKRVPPPSLVLASSFRCGTDSAWYEELTTHFLGGAPVSAFGVYCDTLEGRGSRVRPRAGRVAAGRATHLGPRDGLVR